MRITSCVFIFFLLISSALHAQEDSSHNKGIDSFLLRKKGLLGKLARSIITNNNDDNVPVRNDLLFRRFEGRIIRKIEIIGLPFGTPISDTSKTLRNRLTKLANNLHHRTRKNVISNNLFFKKGSKLSAALLADNERHLRDQPYIQDARITVQPVRGSRDSVDISVITKDVLSIGGSVGIHSSHSADVSAREENFAGDGDRLELGVFYDQKRLKHFSTGFEVIKRNIAGTFIDATAGYTSYKKTFNSGQPEELTFYSSLVRPLVNPYLKLTYSLEAAFHKTRHGYYSDSIYKQENQYKYFNYDAWVGWNTGAFKLVSDNEDDRLRTLVGLRYFKQQFQEVPLKYATTYNYLYADITGVLMSIDILKQNTYKTKFIYGFGRNEDVPEGIDISFTTGWTRKQAVDRAYFGLGFQRYYFTSKEGYFNYTARAGMFKHKNKWEDIDILFNLDYFSRLITMNPRWKQRTFISGGFTRQFNQSLNEPLFLESGSFGLPEWRTNKIVTGNARLTLKGESVFFSPLNIANFRFAPFVFGNSTYLLPTDSITSPRKWYTSIGAGIRTRNEALIFGTIELKAFFFPGGNYTGKYWRVELNTRIRFKYNQQLLNKPAFVEIN